MELKNYIENLDAIAEAANPIKQGDWRDNNGILHCGKCGKPMEHVTKIENIHLDLTNRSEEQVKRTEEMREWLAGRKHRIPCECKEKERADFEKMQKEEQIKDNVKFCFGASENQTKHAFAFDDNQDSNASRVSRQYSSGFEKYKNAGWNLIFYGDVGTGKTFYACAIANKLLQNGYKVKYTSLKRIIDDSIKLFLPLQSILDMLCENDLIVLDDFGSECTSEEMYAKTYQIVNEFYERKKPLVITTNLSKEKMTNSVTVEQQRIYSRLLERSTMTEVKSPCGDRRFQKIENERFNK